LIARRDVVIGAVFLGAFLVLAGLVRVAGPALASWKTKQGMGDSYSTVEIAGNKVNYSVYIARGADAERDARRLANALDAFIASAAAPDNELGLRPPDGTVRILLFETQRDFEAWGDHVLRTKLEHNGGFFKPSERLIGFVREGAEIVAEDKVRHEGAHMLMDAASRDGGLPPWLGEGMACYLETPGARSPWFLGEAAEVARSKEGLRLLQVVSSQQDVFRSAENVRYYAVAASLVKWLMDDAPPELRTRFIDFFRGGLLGAGRGPGDLSGALQQSLEQVEKALADWLAAAK
jgi:hypothetical protein